MTDTPMWPKRRHLLGLLAGLPVLGQAGRSMAAGLLIDPAAAADAPFPDGATILVAGPESGSIQQWAQAMRPGLAQSLAPGVAIHQANSGGADGVTGANQFDARVAPDGRTVLLTPGEAVLAWLVGDPRAQFDVGHWLPIMAATAPAVVVGRPAVFRPGGTVRIAAAQLAGPDLPAILAIELLGGQAQLVPGLADEANLRAAFAHGAVDAALLRGHHVPGQLEALGGTELRPIFTFGARDVASAMTRAASFPDVPYFAEFYLAQHGHTPSGPLASAWQAAAIASQLEFGLVLPQLTPAALVALWRRAGNDAASSLDLQSMALALAVQPLGGPAATASLAPMAANEAALIALRQWLATRFHWRAT